MSVTLAKSKQKRWRCLTSAVGYALGGGQPICDDRLAARTKRNRSGEVRKQAKREDKPLDAVLSARKNERERNLLKISLRAYQRSQALINEYKRRYAK